MKKLLVTLVGCSMLLGAGCVDQVNVGKTLGAASDLGTAATTSDAELKSMSKAMRAQGDK